jgi:hypothetical protein
VQAFTSSLHGAVLGLLNSWPELVLRHMARVDLAKLVGGLRFITLLAALQDPARCTRQNLLGLLAAYFPLPDSAGWKVAWEIYSAAFHLAEVDDLERETFWDLIATSARRAVKYFQARLIIGAEEDRNRDRTQSILSKYFFNSNCT